MFGKGYKLTSIALSQTVFDFCVASMDLCLNSVLQKEISLFFFWFLKLATLRGVSGLDNSRQCAGVPTSYIISRAHLRPSPLPHISLSDLTKPLPSVAKSKFQREYKYNY